MFRRTRTLCAALQQSCPRRLSYYFNRLDKQDPAEIKPDYICKDLKEVQTILLIREFQEGSIVV